MQVKHTSGSDETSVTVERENGTRVDFCHMNNELIIGETSGETGDNHHQIVLSLQEARELQSHLNAVL